MDARGGRRDGFSLIEVLIALVILSVGLLAMAGTTVWYTRQIQVADLRTQRAAAVNHTAAKLRANFSDLTCTETGQESVDGFTVEWKVVECPPGTRLLRVRLVSKGPDYVAGKGWEQGVKETSFLMLSAYQ